MKTYIVLLRGINVGGKNKIPMTSLKYALENKGFKDVKTFIQSGNIILRSHLNPQVAQEKIEALLMHTFTLDSSIIKALVLTVDQLQSIIDNKPEEYGEHPNIYHSDIVFLIGVSEAEAMSVFNPRAGVDKIWPGKGVVYSQRLSAERTKSRLSKIVGTPVYQSMTLRSWSTTIKLLALAKTY